jgi:hypothetical protein
MFVVHESFLSLASICGYKVLGCMRGVLEAYSVLPQIAGFATTDVQYSAGTARIVSLVTLDENPTGVGVGHVPL